MKHYLIGGIYFAAWTIATIIFAVHIVTTCSVIGLLDLVLAAMFAGLSISQFKEAAERIEDRDIVCFWARLFRKIGLRKLAAWYVALPEKRIQKLLNSK